MVRCLREDCGHEGPVIDFPPAMTSVYHDLRCPECGTTNLDTTDLDKGIPDYCYGDNNFLRMEPRS